MGTPTSEFSRPVALQYDGDGTLCDYIDTGSGSLGNPHWALPRSTVLAPLVTLALALARAVPLTPRNGQGPPQ